MICLRGRGGFSAIFSIAEPLSSYDGALIRSTKSSSTWESSRARASLFSTDSFLKVDFRVLIAFMIVLADS